MNVSRKLTASLGTLFLFLAKTAIAIPAGNSIELAVDIVVHTASGTTHTGCQTQVTVKANLKRQWWLSLVETPAITTDGAEENANPIRCGDGHFAADSPDRVVGHDYPGFIAEVFTVVRFDKTMLDEQILVVDTRIFLRQRLENSNREYPGYRESELRRELYFSQAGSAFIPLLTPGTDETADLENGEVFLRVSASIARENREDAYGKILVRSGITDARVYLDGGLTRKAPDNQQLMLHNVPSGMHEVSVHDVEGNEVRKAVRVLADRTVLVDLDLTDLEENATPGRLLPLGVNEQGYPAFRRVIDSAVVVKIPAGEFLMGNRNTERSPMEHTVWVSDFLMDKTGVSWGQFKKYAAATGYPLPPAEPYWGFPDDHPAVYVTWEEAKNYCEWTGARLPTEAEREKGARGTDERKFPWGNQEPEPNLGVFRRSWGYNATSAVGTHPDGASPYGLLDMGGNVWEWCSDWYDTDYYAVSPYRDPKGPENGISHVVRGGSWDSRPDVLSASCRSWGHRGYNEGDFGFRCAMNVTK